jgi:hypothetical protein
LGEEFAETAASASQSWSVGTNSIDLSVQTSGSGSESGVFAYPTNFALADATVMTDLSVEFALTSPYMVQFNGDLGVFFNPLTSLNGGEASLEFAGFQRSLEANEIGGLSGQVLLGPGTYVAAADTFWTASAVGGFMNPHEFQVTGGAFLTADFTPVPEPRWISILAVLLATWALITAKRRSLGDIARPK